MQDNTKQHGQNMLSEQDSKLQPPYWSRSTPN